MSIGTKCLVAVLFMVSSVKAAAPDAEEIIAKLVSRADQVASGILRFKVRSYVEQSDGRIESDVAEEFTLAIDGADWMQRYVNSNNKTLSNDTLAAIYSESNSSNPDTYKSLTLTGPKEPLTSNKDKIRWKTCVLIGTIVAPSVRAYIAEHAADAKVTEAVVDSIDCNVLEFSVANDMLFPVFRSIHPDLLRVPNVTLRLSVSKRMGCVLVRYELVSPNGASYHVIESADIANIGDNVYVPRRWKRTRQRKASALIEEIELVSAEYVNAALPDSAFEFNVPASTRVADQRPGRPSRIFTLKDGVRLGAIDNAVADELPPKVIPIASPKERSNMIYLVVFNGLCIVVLALVICKRVLSKGK